MPWCHGKLLSKKLHIATYFLITESHLTSRIPCYVHTAQEHSIFSVGWSARQLRPDSLLILFVYHVVHAVTVDEKVLLMKHKFFYILELVSYSELNIYLFKTFILSLQNYNPNTTLLGKSKMVTIIL